LLDTAGFTNKIKVKIYLNTKLLNFQPVNQQSSCHLLQQNLRMWRLELHKISFSQRHFVWLTVLLYGNFWYLW